MDLNFLFINILNGVVYGAFLLLTSLGLSLVFGLGRVVATPGALAALARAGQGPAEFLARHGAGD